MTDEDLQSLPDDWNRALAVVAHPDDIEFGTSSAVAAWTAAGKSVTYLLVTRGQAGIDGLAPAESAVVREAEQRASAKIVGVSEVEFMDYRDGEIEYGLGLRRDMAAAIRRHRPDFILGFNGRETTSTGKWNTPDHRHTAHALLDAVGDAGNRWIFEDLGLEPWGGVTHVAMANSPQPTHAVDVTDHLDAGIASLEAHSAYLGGLNPPVTSVAEPMKAFAELVGRRFGGRPAVALEIIAR
ncbi:PIG-L deacetylase family protein [Streptomyces sp. E5N298]|jgi:LmbE family N-acetylglucosaminyl deacetylase|uniref:PIG-L deacetylase family protein n=1 Tax=Streptomyces sp. E5N298 TaxID=1851983 RepID=UPI000EF585F3|nr:PIG-L deacetylase family protein [Streptomyces sp. E5N298]